MSDILKGFFTGMEEFAKTMRDHVNISEQTGGSQRELIEKVSALTDRVSQLLDLLENKIGTAIEITPAKGKRMMDIKEKILEKVQQSQNGIRPPQLARQLGTKVQNLYPHLKSAVASGSLRRDNSGVYYSAEIGKK